MSLTATTSSSTISVRMPSVGMGQILTISNGECAGAVLGSCIGLVLWHSKTQTAVVGHIVLPEDKNRSTPPGKFADTTVPHMVGLLTKTGVVKSQVVAKIAGGANMFKTSGPLQIGEANYEIVTRLLRDSGIPLVAEHVGGTKGRRITVKSQTGEITIEVAGEKAVLL